MKARSPAQIVQWASRQTRQPVQRVCDDGQGDPWLRPVRFPWVSLREWLQARQGQVVRLQSMVQPGGTTTGGLTAVKSARSVKDAPGTADAQADQADHQGDQGDPRWSLLREVQVAKEESAPTAEREKKKKETRMDDRTVIELQMRFAAVEKLLETVATACTAMSGHLQTMATANPMDDKLMQTVMPLLTQAMNKPERGRGGRGRGRDRDRDRDRGNRKRRMSKKEAE